MVPVAEVVRQSWWPVGMTECDVQPSGVPVGPAEAASSWLWIQGVQMDEDGCACKASLASRVCLGVTLELPSPGTSGLGWTVVLAECVCCRALLGILGL